MRASEPIVQTVGSLFFLLLYLPLKSNRLQFILYIVIQGVLAMMKVHTEPYRRDFDKIIERIKSHKNIRYDIDVAELLGMTQSAFAERKRRNSTAKHFTKGLSGLFDNTSNWIITFEKIKDLGTFSHHSGDITYFR